MAQQIAGHEVRTQHIDLTTAMTIAHNKTSRRDAPRSGSCPTGRLIRLVLVGSFPMQESSVKAEEIYFNPLSHGLGVCSTAYLDAIPTLPTAHDTVWVPGTASRGD